MKKLLVFHSYSGNTEKIADLIKAKVDCDLLQLQPEKPFSDNYQTVVEQYQNNSIKAEFKIRPIDVDLTEYDEIILGSPVWWYTITPVIATFLKENDLSGKKIYPFATNAGWLGHTFQDINKLCPNSVVEKGQNIVFDEDYSAHKIVSSQEELETWINKLI